MKSDMMNGTSNCQVQVEALLRALELLSQIADDSPSASAAALELDELQTTSPLQDSHLALLRDSMERLKSTNLLLQQDADSHAQQMVTLQHELYDNSIRIHKLEKAVQKLHSKNQRLKQQAERQKRTLAKQVKQFVVKKNEDDHRHQLFAHERLLKLEGGSNNNSNRSRCSSRDTDFSDVEMVALQSPMSNGDDLSVVSSASSVSTTPSFVTDEGIATVRYSPAAVVKEERTLPAAANKPKDYDLIFPQGTRIGLQFHKVPLEKTQRGILNDALSQPVLTMSPSKEEAFPFSVHFKLDALRGKHQAGGDDYAYLVSGHYGFDCIRRKPKLGARLVKVNGESVEHMTLDKIKATIKCNKRASFSLTFRNEPLSAKQQEILDKAVLATNQQHEERHASESGSGSAGEQDKGGKPVIICMHEEGPSRFSSFLHSARNRAHSDSTVRVDLSDEGEEKPSNVSMSPSESRGFYSILHGPGVGKDKIDSDAVASKREVPSGDATGTGHTPTKNRISSMLSNVRSRTLSENAVSENVGKRDESSEAIVTSPSGRGLYAILHGDTGTSVKAESTPDASYTLPSSDREGTSEKEEDDGALEAANGGSRITSFINGARSRTFSDSVVRDDPPSSDREPESTEEIAASIDPPNSVPGKRINGSKKEVDSEPVLIVDTCMETAPSPSLSTETPPSQKLKKGMKSVGSKFKSLF